MQTTASVDFFNTLKRSVSLDADAQLIAEWNHNRFAGPAVVTNVGYADVDTDEFPLSSIVEPNRPDSRGILKARTTGTAAYIARGSNEAEAFTQSAYAQQTPGANSRSYTTSAESKYKYWTSPTRSGTALTGGIYTIASGVLEIKYTAPMWTNKIVAIFEDSVNLPKNITLAYKTSNDVGAAWVDIAGTYQVNSEGVLEVWRNSDGTWGGSVYREAPIQVAQIRVSVAGLDSADAHLSVIEISARLELDLSDFLIEYDTDASMSEFSLIAPMGTCSSNEATVSLSNIDGRFDNDRPVLRKENAGDPDVTNLLYGLVDKNVRMRLEFGMMVNGDYEYVRQFTMWTDSWNSQNEETVSVALKDSSVWLQGIKPNAFLHEKLTSVDLVWRICDSVGFNDYSITSEAAADKGLIEYFWTDPEKTVWDHFTELSEATQTAIYFDEYDVLQVMPRNAALDLGREVDWTFDSEPVGTDPTREISDFNKLPDIVELTQTYDFEANQVNVKYLPTSVSAMKGNVAPMETVWEPEGTTVLRSSRLRFTLTTTAASFVITASEAVNWPFSGTVQIEGEFIEYDAKGVSYRAANGSWAYTYVKDHEAKLALDKLNPSLGYQNYYNGYMRISKRGKWGTKVATHKNDLSGWGYNRYRTLGGPMNFWNGGISHNTKEGLLKLATNKTFGPNSWYTATRGSRMDAPPYWYGTRMRFPTTGYSYGAAGLLMNAGDFDSGWYVELVRTAIITPDARIKWTNELCFYVKYPNGSIKRMGPNGGRGVIVPIVAGIWYDIDVRAVPVGLDGAELSIMLNGVTRMNVTVPNGQGTTESFGGRHGFFTRGFTHAEFEYLYSATHPENPSFDQNGWFDRVQGGYQSSQWDREWTYDWATTTRFRRNRPTTKQIARRNSRLMDEFGPVVHEVREFDVKFEKKPVIHSTLYYSNDKQVICPEYNSNPFGASFVLANTSRVNAVINGEDTLMFGADNPVEQRLFVYGRVVNQDEAKVYTVKDAAAINRRGLVELDIESPWIQNEDYAKKIGEWITTQWSGGCDEVQVSSFGNPLIQLGDLVAIDYADKSMTHATHKYFVVAINHTYDGGLESKFTLRRAKY